jgi:hypothetical protein
MAFLNVLKVFVIDAMPEKQRVEIKEILPFAC